MTVHTSSLTDEGLMVDEVVKVSLDEIIGADLEEFNDLLDDLTCPPGSIVTGDGGQEFTCEPLEDIGWEVVGVGDEPNTIMLRVTGKRELVSNDED